MNIIELQSGNWHYHIGQDNEKDLIFRLNQPGANLILTGLVDAVGESAPRLSLRVEHRAPQTTADVRIHTVARDTAAPTFTGLLRIDPAGRGSSSRLSHRSLLLGETSRSFSLPSLEILNDEVTCTHASTCQTITEEDTFPLQARGLTAQEAETALLAGFMGAMKPDKSAILC